MKEELMASKVLIKRECERVRGKCMWCDLAENVLRGGKQYWICTITEKKPREWE